METVILKALGAIPALKTVGEIEVLGQLHQQSLQAHQLPAACLLPPSITATPNTFMGGHIQQTTWTYPVLLITALPQASRQTLSITSLQLTNTIIIALSGLSDSEKSLNFVNAEQVDVLSSLQSGQLLQSINFTTDSSIRKYAG